MSDVLVTVAMAHHGAKTTARTAALERHGVLTPAPIMAMSETGTRINDQLPIKLGLRIEGPEFGTVRV
ncbi:hypothetical protein [Nonomuraea sp. NPDC005650]|uniref:hypothetical protein n=1 Tax=Nonomuraea sp. NPDC005650 TaxID=3157045 RepID=UPI0033AB6524